MKKKSTIPNEQMAMVVILILAIILLVIMLTGCGWLCEARESAVTVSRTIRAIDVDGNKVVTFLEMLTYIVGGYFGGRTIESGCRYGVKKLKHGGHSIGTTSCETGIVSRNRQCGDQAIEDAS